MARVLLVDDDAEVRETTAIRLQIDGHHVISAASRQEALELADGRQTFDVAVLDLHLPHVDELLELLRGHRATAQLPVVFYRAHMPNATSVHGLSLADTGITKGQPLTRVLSTINSLSA